MATVAVDVQQVSKRFRLYHEKYTSLKEKLIHAGRIPYDDLWALRDVSFEVEEGETVGILGRNGSGKSTLLKCVCGVLQPSAGQVVVQGKLAGLLELGAGFQQDLSGRENIYLNGSMLGLSRREVDRLFDDIVEFAELGQFIDNQVKFYSSGMYVRLGFAVAVNVDPDVLVIDEVLAVGDERFQRKCMDRIKRFQKEGRTILFVSQSPDQVRSICDRAVVLSDGEMLGFGAPGEAVRLFRERLMEAGDVLAHGSASDAPPPAEPPPPAPEIHPAEPDGTGSLTTLAAGGDPGKNGGTGTAPASSSGGDRSRPVRITGVEAFYPESERRRYMLPGEPLVVRVSFQASERASGLVFSLEIRQDDDSTLFRTDTEVLGFGADVEVGPGAVDLEVEAVPLYDGAYGVVVGMYGPGGILYDWKEPACRFEVMNPGRSTGTVAMTVRASLVSADGAQQVPPALVAVKA